METVTNNTFLCEKQAAVAASDAENFDCFDMQGGDEVSMDVVESFETLHQSIPWLQKAQVSSESYKGQLKILQAAIDYIVDLEEQLTEHLSEDLYHVAIRESKAALERTLTASRRPFADVNAAVVESSTADGSGGTDDIVGDIVEPTGGHHQQQHMYIQPHQQSSSFMSSHSEEMQHLLQQRSA